MSGEDQQQNNEGLLTETDSLPSSTLDLGIPTEPEWQSQIVALQLRTQAAERENARLKAQIDQPTLDPHAVKKNEPSQPPMGGRRRLPDPAVFKSRKDDIRTFLRKVDNVITGEYNSFVTDASKVSYLASLLEGDAYLWYSNESDMHDEKQSLRDTAMREPLRYQELYKNMMVAFSDSNEDTVSQRKLLNLKQRGSCQEYSILFRQLAYRTKWNEATRIDIFREGLKPDLQDKLAVLDEPASLDAFIQQAITIDDRMFKYRVLNRPRTGSVARYVTMPVSRPLGDEEDRAHTNTGPGSMDISATTRREPISPLERKRRMDNDLCLYAGCEGHNAKDCPLKKRSPHSKASNDNHPKNY